MPVTTQRDADALLRCVASSPARESFIEVRWRDVGTHAWRQRFHPAHGPLRLPDATRVDAYIGCLPRVRRSGRRDAVASGSVVWVDCDDHEAVVALERFEVPPSLIVASGTHDHRHAYWLLSRLMPPAAIERANRRLAATLGSDQAVAHANAVMRLPGTLNHKTKPPRPVRVVATRPGVVDLDALMGICCDPPERPRRRPSRTTSPSALTAVAPDEYIAVLLGVEVPPSRKVRCPGPHEDRAPSLHVYPTSERGWFCFGCGRGGTIYDLAGLVFGLPTRGVGFLEIDRRLRQLWGNSPRPA